MVSCHDCSMSFIQLFINSTAFLSCILFPAGSMSHVACLISISIAKSIAPMISSFSDISLYASIPFCPCSSVKNSSKNTPAYLFCPICPYSSNIFNITHLLYPTVISVTFCKVARRHNSSITLCQLRKTITARVNHIFVFTFWKTF